MKLKYVFGLGLLIILLFNLFLAQIGANIPVTDGESVFLTHPDVKTQYRMKMYSVTTGFAETLEAFIYSGGSFLKIGKAAHIATVILHPMGNLLIDTGIGKGIDSQFDEFPLWAKLLFHYTRHQSAREILDKNKIRIENVILTHMHWDHASGVMEFPEAEILTTSKEYEYAQSVNAKVPAYIKSQYNGKDIHWKMIEFKSGPYEIFSESHDLYRDGSIVIVRLEGHSPGSIGIFVNLSPKERYFFTGDLTWSLHALTKPAEKHYVSSMIVDFDKKLIDEQIIKLYKFMKERPEIKVIPTHDLEAFKVIPELTQSE